MNTKTNSFDILKALKRAEPLGFLASLSLVISAFSFEGLGNLYKIYGYSVVSAFMFIFSFLFSIVMDYFISTKISQRYPFLGILQSVINFGIYFFLFFGILLLILMAYQFGQSQPQIFIITNAFLSSFIFSMSIYFGFKRVKKLVKGSRSLIFDPMDIIGMVAVVFVSSLSISSVVEAIFDLTGITITLASFILNFIAPFSGLMLGVLVLIPPIQLLKRRRLQVISKFGYAVIVFFIILGATLIVLFCYYLVQNKP